MRRLAIQALGIQAGLRFSVVRRVPETVKIALCYIAEAQVQHDGGADEAVSHVDPRSSSRAIFAESPPADSPPALNFDSPGQQKQREQSFHRECMGIMFRSRETLKPRVIPPPHYFAEISSYQAMTSFDSISSNN